MLKVTKNEPGATTRDFPTIFEAGFHILQACVDCPDGVTVEEDHTGHVFSVQHIADRLPRRNPTQTTEPTHDTTGLRYCEARARKGTGEGTCGYVLDRVGNCSHAADHLDDVPAAA